MSTYQRLSELERSNERVKTGVIGAGMFGSQAVSQLAHSTGMRCSILADRVLSRGYRAYELAGVSRSKVRLVENVEAANKAIDDGTPAITSDSDVLTESNVDVVLEATGSTQAGGRHAFNAITCRKHVVMANVETDVLVGPLLRRMADDAGVVYSLVYGDQPAIVVDHFDWAKSVGFEVVAAGRGSNYTREARYRTPRDIENEPGWFREYDRWFRERFGTELNPVMYNSFLDGTKPAIECAAVSNATGLLPDVDGMHFPAVDVRDMPDILALKSEGGILDTENVVETVTSLYGDGRRVAMGLPMGTFVAFDAPNEYIRECMRHYSVIVGKKSGNAILYRYAHMVGSEAPYTVAKIALYREPTGAPIGFFSDVVSAAKARLERGTVIDACGGGETVYGYIVHGERSRRDGLLPLGLSAGAILKREVAKDALVTYDDVEMNGSFSLDLRKKQDAALWPR